MTVLRMARRRTSQHPRGRLARAPPRAHGLLMHGPLLELGGEPSTWLPPEETRRTDSFPVQVWALKDIFAKLMDRNVDEALESSLDWVTKISKGEVEKHNFSNGFINVIGNVIKSEKSYSRIPSLL